MWVTRDSRNPAVKWRRANGQYITKQVLNMYKTVMHELSNEVSASPDDTILYLPIGELQYIQCW